MKRGTPDHPKTLHLAMLLNLPKWGAVGILESLWMFTARYAPRGDIGKFSDEMIAAGIGWTEPADRLIKPLVECHWLDLSGQFRLVVHDWSEHGDEYADKHLARTGLTYADGKKPRRKWEVSAKKKPRGGHVRTKPDNGDVSVSVSESVSGSVSHSSAGVETPPKGVRVGVVPDRLKEAFDGLCATGKFPTLTGDILANVDHAYPPARLGSTWKILADRARGLVERQINDPHVWLTRAAQGLILDAQKKNGAPAQGGERPHALSAADLETHP